jgi:hypothetical protein
MERSNHGVRRSSGVMVRARSTVLRDELLQTRQGEVAVSGVVRARRVGL